jgi:hypothetical protein
MPSRPTLKEIGDAGEELISIVYRTLGCSVSLSKDKYDQEKDMLIDGIRAEVKTQTIFRFFPLNGRFYRAFTVDIETKYGKIFHNQLKKCREVEKLIFVGRSSQNDRVVRVYEAQPPESRVYYESVNAKDGRKVAGFLIDDMTLIREIKKEHVVEYFMDEWRSYAKSF